MGKGGWSSSGGPGMDVGVVAIVVMVKIDQGK